MIIHVTIDTFTTKDCKKSLKRNLNLHISFLLYWKDNFLPSLSENNNLNQILGLEFHQCLRHDFLIVTKISPQKVENIFLKSFQ